MSTALRTREWRGWTLHEADNNAVGGETFHEDAADFFWSDQHVVRPAEAGLGEAESAQRGNHGEAGGEGKGGPSAVGRIERQDDGNP